MIVYFEWQSCAWKTTLIDKIWNQFQNTHIIRELPIGIKIWQDINEICKKNDINKIQKVKELNNDNKLRV